jgi:hypothetical protein
MGLRGSEMLVASLLEAGASAYRRLTRGMIGAVQRAEMMARAGKTGRNALETTDYWLF